MSRFQKIVKLVIGKDCSGIVIEYLNPVPWYERKSCIYYGLLKDLEKSTENINLTIRLFFEASSMFSSEKTKYVYKRKYYVGGKMGAAHYYWIMDRA